MSGLVSAIRDELENKEFRDSYVAENVRRGLAYQITALRDARNWSRAEFARKAGKPQSNLHRWEDPTYGKFSLSTLIEIAAIFDVGLVARFVSFEELLALRPARVAPLDYQKEREWLATQNAKEVHAGSAVEAFSKWPEQRTNSNLSAFFADDKSAQRMGEPLSEPPIPKGVRLGMVGHSEVEIQASNVNRIIGLASEEESEEELV
jgi:transcriptional regulator with XRE-family HTH domain